LTKHAWQIALIALITSLGLWGLRIVNRILHNHLHLAADAEERSIMILSFLALQKESEFSEKADIGLIVQTVFRPSTTGFLQDDEGPRLYWDIMMAQRKGA